MIQKIVRVIRGLIEPLGRKPVPVPVPAPSPAVEKAIDLAAIEARMKKLEVQIDLPVEHIFSAGVYMRSIKIPAGVLIMGKRHRGATCNILMSGKLALYVGEDQPPKIIEGPMIFTSPPMTKKFAYCIEEAVFANVIPTDETDPDKIEERVIIPEPEYLALIEKEGEPWLLSQ